jgi:hypothetical protein
VTADSDADITEAYARLSAALLKVPQESGQKRCEFINKFPSILEQVILKQVVYEEGPKIAGRLLKVGDLNTATTKKGESLEAIRAVFFDNGEDAKDAAYQVVVREMERWVTELRDRLADQATVLVTPKKIQALADEMVRVVESTTSGDDSGRGGVAREGDEEEKKGDDEDGEESIHRMDERVDEEKEEEEDVQMGVEGNGEETKRTLLFRKLLNIFIYRDTRTKQFWSPLRKGEWCSVCASAPRQPNGHGLCNCTDDTAATPNVVG